MKSKSNPFLRTALLAAAVGLASASVQADVLLTDNFDTNQDGANFNNQPGLSNDQGGTLDPVTSTNSYAGGRTWTVRRGFTDGGSYVSEMAVIGNGTPYGDSNGFNTYSSLDHDFASDANTANALLEVKFNVKVFAGLTSGDWGAIQVGSAQNALITNSTNKFASLFRDNGGTEQWAAGTAVGSAITFADGDLITMTLSNAAGTGSAFNSDGATDVAKIYVNNTLAGTWTNLNFESADGYLTFASLNANLAVDNLVITTVPAAPPTQNDGTWIAGAGDWSNTANWLSATIAQGADQTATFNGASTATATMDSVFSIGTLLFSGADHTIASGAGSLVLQGAAPSISVEVGRVATITASLYGVDGMQKTNAGTLVISGSNAYTGATDVTNGTLKLQNSYASSSFGLASGAVLELNGGWDGAATTFSGPGTLRKTGAGNFVWGAGIATFALDSGSLIDVQEGSFTAGSSANENWSGNLSDLNVASGATLNTVEANVRVNKITGTGIIGTGYNGGGYSNLTIGVDNGSSTFDGVIQNTGNNPSWVGNLVKEGSGTITLTGDNSYTGNTTVNDGALVLTDTSQLEFVVTDSAASNQVTGAATATFNGSFNIDTASVSGTTGHIWLLVDRASLTGESFGSTFSVAGFTPQLDGLTWTMTDAKGAWSFSEDTGELTLDVGTDYDSWKTANGVTGAENDDDDNDGLTNHEEYAFGLDPTGGSSVNPITSPLNKSNGKFSYTRRALGLPDPALSYTIWYSTDLSTWAQDNGATEGTPSLDGEVETVEVTVSPALLSNPKLFIQVRAN